MKVTVLVAVYNASSYLSVCMDSLLGQTYADIEIICIDDASTDDSWAILQQYAARDTRVVLLRQTVNGGQAKARNRGLTVATGDFITMVDSDDWLAPDAIEQACAVVALHPKADAVLLDVVYHDDLTGREWSYHYRTEKKCFSGEEAFRLSLDWRIHGLYLVRRDIHVRYPYDDSCRLYSDDNTTRFHYLHSREVWRSNGRYYYRQHGASMTHAISMLRFDYLAANYSLKQTMLEENVDKTLVDFYEQFRWTNLIGLCIYYDEHRKDFTVSQRREICHKLQYYYKSVETDNLPVRLTWKFGYIPFKPFFRLFMTEVRIYARLRRIFYFCIGREQISD